MISRKVGIRPDQERGDSETQALVPKDRDNSTMKEKGNDTVVQKKEEMKTKEQVGDPKREEERCEEEQGVVLHKEKQ